MKLLITYFLQSYFFPRGSKYRSQQPILEHPHSVFLTHAQFLKKQQAELNNPSVFGQLMGKQKILDRIVAEIP
jgi:hypothetical protein